MSVNDLIVTPRGVRFRGRYFPCAIGSGGISADKREGDGATPAGIHRVTGLLYRADRMAAPTAWAVPIGPNDLWSDDLSDPAYNQLVRAPHGFSHEKLRRGDRLYDLVIMTDWNWPMARKGKGSAIFLHRWRRPGYPTAGCVAFRPDHLAWITGHLTPATRIIVPAGGARGAA